MADPNIIAAKNYLNSYYGGNSSWIPIKSEYTGVELISGIIRGFQISCGLSSPTGEVGPATLNEMKSMPKIKLMDPEDEPSPFVCLIQCALFAKGYAAGGITGIYYKTGEAAIASMQEDAGLPVTKIIDWKVWAGLLSYNWFTMSSGGDKKLQRIQRQLNADWSDVIGVQACDGIMSRNTALSLLGALQAALNVNTDYILNFNALNFGPATKSAFITQVGNLMSGYNDAKRVPLNKIAQYGLYFNGCDPYNYDGIFDITTKSAVSKFQNKYALLNLGLDAEGVIGITTMMSLITSKGNTERRSLACDTSTVLNQQQAKDLKAEGYQVVGRYLTGTVGFGANERPKALTLTEIKYIKNAGLTIFPIFQDGGTARHFENSLQGYSDATDAIFAANRLGFTTGTTIYFAVDFDCTEDEAVNLILPYFRAVKQTFSTIYPNKYKVGIYASRQVCTMAYEKGFTEYSFVSDMSTGFVGNLGHPIPDNWAFDQFYELGTINGNQFPSSPSFDIDKVAVSGKDFGCKTFDEREELSEAEKLKAAREKFSRDIMKSIGVLSKFIGIEINFDGTKIPVGTYMSGGCIVNLIYSASTKVSRPATNEYSFDIAFDSDGSFSSSTLDKINEIVDQIDAASKNDVEKLLKNIALSAKCGTVKLTLEVVSSLSFRVKISAEVEDLFEFYGVHGSVSNTLTIEVTLAPNYEYKGYKIKELDLAKITEVTLVVTAAVCYDILSGIAKLLTTEGVAEAIFIGVIFAALLKYGWVIVLAV